MRTSLLPFLAFLTLACGGGGSSSPTSATKLHYANPATPVAAGHYQLVVEPASNDSAHVLLDLVGPLGSATQGAAIFVTVGPGAQWGNPGGAQPNAKAGTELSLGTPALFRSKLSGSALQVGIFQTGATAATLGSGPLAIMALDLATGTNQGAVTLAPTSGKTPVYVDGNQVKQPLVLDVGTLAAQ